MKIFPLLSILFVATSAFAADSLPEPWKQQDVGTAETPGTASTDGSAFTLQGTMDIWGPADGCHIVWQPFHGDGEIIARVTSVENTAGHAKGSICIRESLDAGARHATMAVTPADGTQFLSREQKDGKSTSQITGQDKGRMPCWVKIIRKGNEFSGYESGDGENWTPVGKISLDIGQDVVAGICSSSHVKDKLCKVTIDHVKVSSETKSAK